MGLKTEKWAIAFRKKTDFTDQKTPFIKLPGSAEGWYADPFLFEKDGKTYLFAEYMSYKTVKGSLAFCEYEPEKNTFGKWQEIITEPFHLSYPYIFERDHDIYILPETSEANELILYRAVSFPNHWERCGEVMHGFSLVDTTLLPDGKSALSQQIKNGEAEKTLLLSVETAKIIRDMTDLRPLLTSRPGGKVITLQDQWILPTQDCRSTYGGALIFYRTDQNLSCFEEILSVTPEDITVEGENAQICGIHTYNSSSSLEVIDYKTYAVSPVRIFNRVLQKAGIR